MSLNKEKILKFISSNREILKSRFGVVEIYLFGSFSRGEENESSDIDLFVEFDEVSFHKLAGLKIFFEDNLNRKSNIIRKRQSINKSFIKVIQKDLINA